MVPRKEELIPQKVGTIRRKERMVPRNEELIRRKEGTVPRKVGMIRRKEEMVPRKVGTIPQKEGLIRRKGEMPTISATNSSAGPPFRFNLLGCPYCADLTSIMLAEGATAMFSR